MTPAPRPVMATHGLTGSLSREAVQRTLDPRLDRFADCFFSHSSELGTIGGRVELKFQVAEDGRVADVYAIDSTVGHRDVERCVVDVASATRFPAPRGGVAELTWPLELEPPSDVRHPVTWDPARVRRVVARRGADVRAACQLPEETSGLQITTYVSRRGRVLSAGAVARGPVEADQLDCVARAVRGWRMPTHRRHQAKVTFDLP